ncbi:hypothetical protein CBOM_06635 [Ceraceosorus bombacis]|uniref:OTU domain-containing protein n=2 Tax=Ceraceosorus bombacis TaxID=401625 RepID=A0A0N7LAI8_9BASI|nr:hypothetical protein CBOM_06635 [Ceraceosorus bombacis]
MLPLNTRWTKPQDLDGYNMTLMPEALIDPFGSDALVTLSSYAPNIRDAKKYKDWVYVASPVQYCKIELELKLPLLDHLSGKYALDASKHATALINGKQSIHLSQLVEALVCIGCTAVRVQAYGMKSSLKCVETKWFGDADHDLAGDNTWDLGAMYRTRTIPLFKPAASRATGMQVDPMLLALGRGYGSVDAQLQYEEQDYRVKVYPRLVHRLKALAGKHPRWPPSSVRMSKARLSSLERKAALLQEGFEEDDYFLGGCRIEVTITAPTLNAAVKQLARTPLLALEEWLQPLSEELEDLQIQVIEVTPDSFFAQWAFMKAQQVQLRLFKRDHNAQATPLEKCVLVDFQNCLGWNAGYRASTRHTDSNAWWLSAVHMSALAAAAPVRAAEDAQWQDITLGHITEIPLLRELFSILQPHMMCRYCQLDDSRYIRNWDAKQQRIKCNKKGRGGTCQGPQLYLNKEQAFLASWVNKLQICLDNKFLAGAPASAVPAKRTRSECWVEVPVTRRKTSALRTANAPSATRITAEAEPNPLHASPTAQSALLGNCLRISDFIKGDGNCQFRAWAHLHYSNQSRFWNARQVAAAWLKTHAHIVREFYAPEDPTVLDQHSPLDLTTRRSYANIAGVHQDARWCAHYA